MTRTTLRKATVALLSGALLALAGCTAIVEDRVETRLANAGVPPAMASCMAAIWARDLSVSQIKRIGDFAGRIKAERQTLTVTGLIGQVREWNDPQTLAVVTTSAARCALTG